MGKPRHSSLGFQTAESRTPRAPPEPQGPVTTSATGLAQIRSGNSSPFLEARPLPPPALDTPPRPRPRPHFRPGWDHVPWPRPPTDTAPLASSVPASLPPEVGRLSLSGYGSPSGAGGRTGELSGGGGGGGGNGGAGAGAERSGGDESRGLRGRPAPGPAGTGGAGWREHESPRRGRAGPDWEEGVGPGGGRQPGLTPQPSSAFSWGAGSRGSGGRKRHRDVRAQPVGRLS